MGVLVGLSVLESHIAEAAPSDFTIGKEGSDAVRQFDKNSEVS